MLLKNITKILFILLLPLTAIAQQEKFIELMEEWTLSDEQQKLVPISSPVNVRIETIDGIIESLRLEMTNTQPPSLLSNKAVAAGKRSVWLKNVSIVVRPKEDYRLWLAGAKGDTDRKGAERFTLTGEAKVNVEKNGVMLRSIVPVSLDVAPYAGGYGATIIYTGERKPKESLPESSILTESGSNPIFTVQAFGEDYHITIKGRVDVKMTEYKKLYEGSWYR